MEEWVGAKWHRAITRVAEPERTEHQVTLEAMRHSIALLYRARAELVAELVKAVAVP